MSDEPVSLWDDGRPLIIWDYIVFTAKPRLWQFQQKRRDRAILKWYEEVYKAEKGV